MASFEQHINGAIITSGLGVIALYSTSIISIKGSFILLALGTIGGVLPDLDSDTSKPVQITFKIFSIFLPLLAILILLDTPSITKIFTLWILSSLVLHFGIFKMFLYVTNHRGIFHSIPMGVFIALTARYFFNNYLDFNDVFSTLAGMFVFLGFMVHLLLDELFSIDALGMKVKSSFGSALKFYDKNNFIGSIILYILIISISITQPLQSDIFSKVYKSFERIKL